MNIPEATSAIEEIARHMTVKHEVDDGQIEITFTYQIRDNVDATWSLYINIADLLPQQQIKKARQEGIEEMRNYIDHQIWHYCENDDEEVE